MLIKNKENKVEQIIRNLISSQISNLTLLMNSSYDKKVSEAIRYQIEALRKGNKILIAGNGGSAADAQHFAAELVGRFMMERKGIPAIALTTDSSILTSIGNDYGFDRIFSRQVEALGNQGDIFIALSTSGNSNNIISAVNEASQKGLITIGLLGKDGGKLADICDLSIVIPNNTTARVQEMHIMTIHLMCEIIEKELA